MIRAVRFLCCVLVAAASFSASGNESGDDSEPVAAPDADKGSTEQHALQVAGETSKSIIESLSDRKLVDADLATQALEVINNLLKSTRADQNSIYLFVRTVNRSMDSLGASCGCEEFVNAIRSTNSKLMRASYTDGLFQNANLSNQIKTRLPLLIADSVQLNAPDAEDLRDDFQRELDLLAERFLSSRRFRAGIGLSYSYLPRLTYAATPRVDFSPFQTTISGGSDLVVFNTEFSNRSVPALVLSAKVPVLQLDVAIPDSKHRETTTTTVQQREGDADNDLLARTTIMSELDVNFDISLKLSAPDVYNWWREGRGEPRSNLQFDYGVGIGMTGFEIRDDVSTDVRFRTDVSSTFNDLAAGSTITSAHTNSFNTVFVSLYYAFRVSDEFQLGLEGRFYQKDQTSTSAVEVDDGTISLGAVWYPTFNW